jgi:hypothetical protein
MRYVEGCFSRVQSVSMRCPQLLNLYSTSWLSYFFSRHTERGAGRPPVDGSNDPRQLSMNGADLV